MTVNEAASLMWTVGELQFLAIVFKYQSGSLPLSINLQFDYINNCKNTM